MGHRKPIERHPHDAILPAVWYPLHAGGFTYRVRDGDSWESVGDRFFTDTKELIFYNFLTTNPDEVNWYLRSFVGCNKVSPSGNNWMFSSSARPGIIFVPPADHDPIDVDPDEVCVWTPGSAKVFLQRLMVVAMAMPGNTGDRVRKLVQVVANVGYPKCRDLWYYNPLAILEYVSFHTNEARRREMTKGTNGTYPFDGYSGVAGEWQVHPIADLLDSFACKFDADEVKRRLEWVDDQMYQGWHSMEVVLAQTSQGGGSGFGPSVSGFIGHVQYLSANDTHLYWAFS